MTAATTVSTNMTPSTECSVATAARISREWSRKAVKSTSFDYRGVTENEKAFIKDGGLVRGAHGGRPEVAGG